MTAKLISKPIDRQVDQPQFAKLLKDGMGALYIPAIPSDNMSKRITERDDPNALDHGETWAEIGWYKPCKGFVRSSGGVWYPCTYSMPKSRKTGKRYVNLRIAVKTCDREYTGTDGGSSGSDDSLSF